MFVEALDPSFGLLRGTGVDEFGAVAMADEQLDLPALEVAAAVVTELPDDVEISVLVRERDVTQAWMEAQQRIAALSSGSKLDVVEDVGHQIPTDAPQAVADAVRRLLDDDGAATEAPGTRSAVRRAGQPLGRVAG